MKKKTDVRLIPDLTLTVLSRADIKLKSARFDVAAHGVPYLNPLKMDEISSNHTRIERKIFLELQTRKR